MIWLYRVSPIDRLLFLRIDRIPSTLSFIYSRHPQILIKSFRGNTGISSRGWRFGISLCNQTFKIFLFPCYHVLSEIDCIIGVLARSKDEMGDRFEMMPLGIADNGISGRSVYRSIGIRACVRARACRCARVRVYYVSTDRNRDTHNRESGIGWSVRPWHCAHAFMYTRACEFVVPRLFLGVRARILYSAVFLKRTFRE